MVIVLPGVAAGPTEGVSGGYNHAVDPHCHKQSVSISNAAQIRPDTCAAIGPRQPIRGSDDCSDVTDGDKCAIAISDSRKRVALWQRIPPGPVIQWVCRTC